MFNKALTAIALVLGLMMLANGVYMTVAPESWYWLVLAGTGSTGPWTF
ncbi:MAG: hypothetical protein RJQ07_13360 [Pseudomonadales bacterium]